MVAAVDPTEFQQNLRRAMQKAIPSVSQTHLDNVVKPYSEAKDNKAIAGSREKNGSWRFTNRESAFAAEQTTLEACQLANANPCILVAVNGTIASMPDDGTWVARTMSRVTYEGQYNPQQIPIVNADTRGRRDVADYSFARAPKAIALHPWGMLFVSTGKPDQAAAEADALKTCNEDPRRAGKDGPCFLYAIGNRVVLPQRITGPRAPARTIAEADPPDWTRSGRTRFIATAQAEQGVGDRAGERRLELLGRP